MAITARPAEPTRRWGTLELAAVENSVSADTIRRWVKQGHAYAERIGPRRLRVDLDSIVTTRAHAA